MTQSLKPVAAPTHTDPDPKLVEMARAWQERDKKRKEKEAFYRGRALAALRSEGVKEPREREIRARIFVIKEESRKKWLLKNCRATIGEVVEAAKKSQEAQA